MTPEGHNDLLPLLESIMREAEVPLDCNQLYERDDVRSVAPSPNRVSDYLGILYRRGSLVRTATDKSQGSKARWAYAWKNKELPAWKQPKEVVSYRPKAILDRPNIYISEDGDNINIELPHLSITIKKKN